MKYGQTMRRLLSILLAAVMLYSAAAEGAPFYTVLAAELTEGEQQTDEAEAASQPEEQAETPDEPEPSAQQEPTEEDTDDLPPSAEGDGAQTEGETSVRTEEESDAPSDPEEPAQAPEDGADEPDEPSDDPETPREEGTEPSDGETGEVPETPKEDDPADDPLRGPKRAAGDNTVTVYFAVPSDWQEDGAFKYGRLVFNAQKGDSGSGASLRVIREMTPTGETYHDQPLYAIELSVVSNDSSSDLPWNGYNKIQFQAYDGSGNWQAQYVAVNGWTSASVFSGKIYDVSDGWVDYEPDVIDHTKFAGKSMAFENKSGGNLTGVTAVFYENVDGTLTEVTRVSLGDVADGAVKTFDIPAEECSYVRFVDGGGNTLGDAYSNFYNEDSAADENYRYNDRTMYCYRYHGTAANSDWGERSGVTVYFDATLSKLHYNKNVSGNYCMPSATGTIRYYATSSSGKPDLEGDMVKEPDHTENGHTWSDVYSVELPAGYDYIVFSAFDMNGATNYGGHGESTGTLLIPGGRAKPCFYADSSDLVIYDGGTRDGYWDEVYQIRDAEAGKGTNVVDVTGASFTAAENTLYISSTFYDYYSDYELNGNNRDSYPAGKNGVSYRTWYPFRQFDQALSDAYRSAGEPIPIYTGHFQPDWSSWGTRFSDISSTLDLYGYRTDGADQKYFMSTNNSTMDVNASGGKYEYAAWGLVKNTLSGGVNGDVMTSNGSMKLPHFDESFLSGNNSKNTVLGDVYHDVAFPFTKKDVFGDGVEYWWFDSAETTLAMRQDPGGAYYLQNVGNQNQFKNVNSSGSTGGDPVSTVYGFFPFNETSTGINGVTYNFGYGCRLEFKFRLTEDGMVLNTRNQKVPIKFRFSGDDDVWVFIDGKLALDVGGAHGRVEGTLNFGGESSTKTATVSAVKASQGSTSPTGTNVTSNFTLTGSNTDEHTLVMFYMERGMWESNMQINFNFPDENRFAVEKDVDTDNVNDLFKTCFDDRSIFTFRIKNLATHFGRKDVSTISTVDPVTVTIAGAKSFTAYPGNIFERTTFGGKTAAHWWAKLDDTTSSWRSRRYGVMELQNAVDISEMQFLEFDFYYDYNDTPSLNNMYLQLEDENGKTMGSGTQTLAGTTYGTVNMQGKTWVHLKIDLSKLRTEDGFSGNLKKIKFGYNYERNIYLDDFTFTPSAANNAVVGFVTDQKEVPDYGSGTSGNLENAAGAVFGVTKDGQDESAAKVGVVAQNGTFVLANGECATFYDQFRRGSYISVEELLEGKAADLFVTKWTMYDSDGKPVTRMDSGEYVTVNPSKTNLKDVSGTAIDDGRTERIKLEEGELAGSNKYQTDGSAYHPDNTIVFRPYTNPDSSVTSTNLKVGVTNEVNVGSLTFEKSKAYAVDDLDGDYRFVVVFTNVGGIGLETAPIQTEVYTLSVGESQTITGIPVGTEFTIYELKPDDGSKPDSVEKDGSTAAFTTDTVTVDETTYDAYAVTGVIPGEDGSSVSYNFKNTIKPTVDVEVRKDWRDENNGAFADPPDTIHVRLERAPQGSESWSAVEGYESVEIGPNTYLDETWATFVYTFSELDKFVDYTATPQVAYRYRVVELTEGGLPLTGNQVTLGGTTFDVTYSDPVLSDDVFRETITNTEVPDTVDLEILKVDAEDSNTTLPGVEFKLEKQDGLSWTTVEARMVTNGSGIASADGLESGTYRITELKTVDGYNLLSAPVVIDIDVRNKTYTVDGGTSTVIPNDKRITVTVRNHKGFTLPETGGTQPNTVLIGGAALVAAVILIYSFVFYGRKRGARRKRH